jgi:hypothetical protein
MRLMDHLGSSLVGDKTVLVIRRVRDWGMGCISLVGWR